MSCCYNCGTQLSDNAKFCNKCGAPVENALADGSTIQEDYPVLPKNESLIDKATIKISSFWHTLDLFCKIATISTVVIFILLIISMCAGKVVPIIFSILQLCAAIVAILMHTGKITYGKTWLKYLLLILSIALMILNISSYSWTNRIQNKTPPSASSEQPNISSTENTKKVSPPYSSDYYIGKDKSITNNSLSAAGFLYITEEPVADLSIAESDKIGTVVSVSINGTTNFQNTTIFEPRTEVIIRYHTYKNVEMPFSSEDAKNMDTDTVLRTFEDLGFVEITTEEMYDLDPDSTSVDFEQQITIGDIDAFEQGTNFPVNSKIQIITHKPYEKFTLKVIIDFIPNIFFNKYDVELNIDEHSETLTHGDDAEFEFRLKEGNYTLTFESTDSGSVKTSVEIELTGDTEAAYKISCYSEEIDVKTLYIENKGAIGTNQAMVPYSASECKYDNYKDIEKAFKEAGFTNITTEILYDIVFGWTEEGEVDSVSIDGKTDFIRGDVFAQDAAVVITYHMDEDDDPNKQEESSSNTNSSESSTTSSTPATSSSVFYSTNTYEAARNGNSGIFSYVSKGKQYDIYWIIDFDEGYVYTFTDRNNESYCDRLRIESGDLNSYITITYHDVDMQWSYKLHFKYVNQPETLIMVDQNGFDYEYTTTDLDTALELKGTKTIYDY